MAMAEETREVREARAPVWEAEVPWVVSYLREDIQDLRNEVREVRRSVQRLDEKIDDGLERLDAKIDARTDGLDAKIEGLRQDMDAKIDARTGELRQEMGELGRTMTVQFRWLVTTMVAVGALVVAILELLR
jgi:chromosome segregation ATPase